MNFETAIDVVENYKDAWGYEGLLETLTGMSVAMNRDELSDKECRAYRVVFREMSKLFAPLEA